MKKARSFKLYSLVIIILLIALAFSNSTSSASITSSITISSMGVIYTATNLGYIFGPQGDPAFPSYHVDHWYVTDWSGAQENPDQAPRFYDTTTLHSGPYSIRMEKDPANPSLSREVDHDGWDYDTTVEAGDHVVFKVWMKVQPSTAGDSPTGGGIRLGIDFYHTTIPHSNAGVFTYITGSQSPNGAVRFPNGTYPATDSLNWVYWGSGWTLRTMDFIVPASITADGLGGYPLGTVVYAPFVLTPWVQIWSNNLGNPVAETAVGWFADAEFYINP
jgi:hypothetical protein